MTESMAKYEAILSVRSSLNYWYGYDYGMCALMQVYVTIRMDDAFTLNCCPTVSVGYEEQVGNAKCTRPFLSLVKGLTPRLRFISSTECSNVELHNS